MLGQTTRTIYGRTHERDSRAIRAGVDRKESKMKRKIRNLCDVGASVELNSGGPTMKARFVLHDKALCEWDGCQEWIPIKCLTVIWVIEEQASLEARPKGVIN